MTFNATIVIGQEGEKRFVGIEHDGIITPATGILIHEAQDIDVLFARYLFDHFGINYGRVKDVSAGEGGLVAGKTPIQHLKEGWVLLDVGGAGEKCPLDKLTHLDHGHSKKDILCSSSIVFDLILSSGIKVNIEDEKNLREFLGFVEQRDLRGGQKYFDLSHLAKILNRKVTSDRLYTRVNNALDFYFTNLGNKPNIKLFERLVLEIFDQKKITYGNLNKKEPLRTYLEKVANGKTDNIPDILRITCDETTSFVRAVLIEEIEKQRNFEMARTEIIKARNGEKSTVRIDYLNHKGRFVVSAVTANDEFHRAALNAGATYIIKQKGEGERKGQTQIFTQKQHQVDVADLATRIRAEEYRARTGKQFLDEEILHQDGTIKEIPEISMWHLFSFAYMLLNGSHTTPEQTPTILSLDKIIELVIESYNQCQ